MRARLRGFLACLPVLCLLAGPAAAEYRLQGGDVVELSVAGLPELKHRVMIDGDGRATFPLIRSTGIGGLTLPEAEQRLGKSYASHLLQSRTPDGREIATAVAPDAVTLTIHEYRPVYLNGDVTKPGAQPFRPGLTVRQAVALAGGYEIMRFRMNNPFIETADFASEYQALLTEQASLEARVWRLEAELAGPGKEKTAAASITSPVAPPVAEKLKALAGSELAARRKSAAASRSHLEDAVRRADHQIDLLEQRRQDEEEGVRQDAADYKQLKDFAARGQLSSARLSESRRFLFLSTTQALQTRVQIAQVERERETTRRQIASNDEDRRLAIMKALAEATSALDKARSRLAGLADKIRYSGLVRSQLVRGKSERPRITIVRAGADKAPVAADEDTALAPGDTVEVAIEDVPLAGDGSQSSESSQ